MHTISENAIFILKMRQILIISARIYSRRRDYRQYFDFILFFLPKRLSFSREGKPPPKLLRYDRGENDALAVIFLFSLSIGRIGDVYTRAQANDICTYISVQARACIICKPGC